MMHISSGSSLFAIVPIRTPVSRLKIKKHYAITILQNARNLCLEYVPFLTPGKVENSYTTITFKHSVIYHQLLDSKKQYDILI